MNLFALTSLELAEEMNLRYGKGLPYAAALYREVFKKGNASFIDAPELASSYSLASRLVADVRLPDCRIVARQEDEGTLKFATAVRDGKLIESVILPSGGRTTLCVSSQVGCRMGCRFCGTGGMGFLRDLEAEEIVWQLYAARFLLQRRVDNVVFMGMGEPLDNFENVMRAVRVMADQRGLDLAESHMTLSTAGHADGIRKLASLRPLKIRLAVSLNAADDGLRSRLMPINRQFPLARLKEDLAAFPLGKNGVIFVEYVLLAGVNDSREDARRLSRYLEGVSVRVNVIAYNGGFSDAYSSPDAEQMRRFCAWLVADKVFVRVRRSRGLDLMAACGQLGVSLAEGGCTPGERERPDRGAPPA